MESPYSAANIAMNQNNGNNASTDSTKKPVVYPNSLFRLVTPRKLITFSTCATCADRIFKNQKLGGIVHDPLTNEVVVTLQFCQQCVADNQSSSFSQLKLVKKAEQSSK